MSFLTVIYSIAPIFVIIVMGYALRRGGIPNTEFWNLNDRLVYWVLTPALLFHKTSTLELSLSLIGSYAAVILGGFGAALAAGLLATRLARLAGPQASSVLQGSARHNTFIALSVAEQLFGGPGLALAALATSMLIPVTNVSVVSIMSILHHQKGGGHIVGAVLRDLGRNPLLLAVLTGVGLNASGIGQIPVLHQTTEIIGNAALPIVLMCVGANLRLRAMRASTLPLILSMLAKFIAFPVVAIGIGLAVGLSELELTIALLFAAAPTSANAYTLARQMGGDAPLMAAITTIQTALAFLLLPLWLLVPGLLF